MERLRERKHEKKTFEKNTLFIYFQRERGKEGEGEGE